MWAKRQQRVGKVTDSVGSRQGHAGHSGPSNDEGPGTRKHRLTWAFARERVTGIEPAFSAWEFDQARSADLGRWTNGQVRSTFLVPARPPRSVEILSVVARMWHAAERQRSQSA